jgi:hypothetical protein
MQHPRAFKIIQTPNSGACAVFGSDIGPCLSMSTWCSKNIWFTVCTLYTNPFLNHLYIIVKKLHVLFAWVSTLLVIKMTRALRCYALPSTRKNVNKKSKFFFYLHIDNLYYDSNKQNQKKSLFWYISLRSIFQTFTVLQRISFRIFVMHLVMQRSSLSIDQISILADYLETRIWNNKQSIHI